MDLDTITVADFKALFFRDFAYLPVWNSSKLYNAGAEVYYAVNDLFYTSIANGNTNNVPTDATKWTPYADDILNFVQDADITKAFGEAQAVFNQALFGTDADIQRAYMYLTAYFLVIDLQAAKGGVYAVGTSGMMSSRSAGSVSESYAIPEVYLSNPIFAQYYRNAYGQKYLALVMPAINGNVGIVAGATLP